MDYKLGCICEFLEEISEFYSPLEFERFQKYIENLINSGDLKEIAVQNHYGGFNEQWFVCTKCKNIWRLVHPDFPFKGLWENVR